MATDINEAEKEWRQIEKEITCYVCGDLFTDPKTIPCLHTFCKQCIESKITSIQETEIEACCPLCRANLPPDGIASIPNNVSITCLVQILKKRREFGDLMTIKCDKCEEDTPAITWCLECDNHLCHACEELHKSSEDFESHKTADINVLFQNPKQAAAILEKAELCESHIRNKLDLFCKTCSSLICQDCTLKDYPHGHQGHDFQLVDKLADEEREKMKLVTAPLKQLLEQVRNGVKRIINCEEQVDLESEANAEKIRATYGEVYKLLKQQEEEIIEKVNTITTSFKQTLASKKESVKLIESQLVSCNEFSERILSTNQKFLTYNNWIESRVDQLTKQVERTSLDPQCKLIVRYRKPAEFVNGLICEVSCLPHVPDCTVSGPEVYSDPIKVTVSLKDIFRSPVVNQSKDLEIYCDKERGFLLNTHIREESKGQYHICYNPKRKENHLLSVYWRGLKVNHEEVKVLMNIRDYNKLKQEVKIINKYGLKNDRLMQPYLLAKGPNNELIVRDLFTHQLVVFDEHYQCSHVIGSGKFQVITGIAADKKGFLYAADRELHCIQKFQVSGEFISKFGSQGSAAGQFQSPCGLALSKSELLFVCDCGNHRIQVFQNKKFRYCFGQHGTEPGTFDTPRDLTLNSNESQLFISEKNNHRVQVFSTQGDFLRVFGNFSGIPYKLQQPVGIHYTADGHVLISSCGTHCVLVFEENGNFTSAIEGTYQGKERFSYPCGVVMMNNGQIVIVDNSTINSNGLVVF